MRKDIKKSSYYVWFLGAQEAKGLRGSEYVLPVVRSLVEREREVEPFKVTLQVSHKGLKIVQNVPGAAAAAPGGKAAGKPGLVLKPAKAETVKHLIPHHAVTCVLQQEDIVACILLLYNPVTKCPVHVHAYRCDSVETAQILCGQLQTLIERPDNQKKLAEIEARLRAKGLLLPAPLPPGPASRRHGQGLGGLGGGGSDGRSTSTRESESSGGSSSERLSGLREERVTNLYDSLAAELREKLGADQDTGHAPILLPPRDYDTVHRQKGNLASVDRRRCLSAAVVGLNAKNVKNAEEQPAAALASASGRANAGKRGSGGSGTQTGRPGGPGALVGSSGGSSGIGSDHAPSPDNESDPRYLDNASSSDEEWNEPSEDSLFLVQPGLAGLGGRGVLSGWRGSHGAAELSLPRARRLHSPAASPSPTSPGTPATPGSLTRTDSRDHPLASAPSSRRRHTSPTPPVDRHAPRDEDGDVPSRTRVRRPQADDRQRARSPRTPRSPRSSPRSPRSPRAARSPPRSLSPGPQHRAAPASSSGMPRRGAAGNHPLSGPMSPRERFQDAKEKFLSLERERLEEQERVMQLNMEKRRSNQQPGQPAAAGQTQSPHSPPIVEPPISPAMVAGPRPRPRPRRPSWSRSRDESDDEMLEPPLSPAALPAMPAMPPTAGRYYAGDDEDDVDFSGNAPPMGGRQRIIAAVNRRMSRESLEDDVDDFACPPARTSASSRPGPPRHEYPAAYRGDRADRAEHPSRGGDSRSDPRGGEPRGADPRSVDPRGGDHRSGDHRSGDHRNGDHRGGDPRGGDHRGGDPRGGDPRGGDPRGGDHRGGDARGIAAVSRSRSVHREDRFRSPARGSYPYPSDAMPPMGPMASMPDDGPHPRYRIPYNEDLDIPLERYRSGNLPHPHARAAAGPPAPRHPAPYPGHPGPRDHDDDLAERERAYLAEKKRRSVFEALEDERRRHSNELAQEFKRRSYQELDERERYPGLDRDTARDAGPPGGPPGHPGHPGHGAGAPRGQQVSARYRHSYAEPPPRHGGHHDLLHRTNSAASPRVGIAAVRPY